MNKWLKKGMLVLTIGCLAFAVTGCQGEEIMDKVLSKTDPKPDTKADEDAKDIAANEPEVEVAKPEWTVNLSGSFTYAPGAEAEPLNVEASTSDEGVITYQWYKSQTNTNGGGTVIEGETQSTFTPSTAEAGTLYYYVVATSSIGSSTNGVTSDTAEVIVSEENTAAETSEETTEEAAAESGGTWKQESKGWWYDLGDGTYPKDEWKQIDGNWYSFDADGFMRTGWYQEGDTWYYLRDNGVMAADADVDGYHLGSDGKMQ